jgi:hypothetical protein
MEVRRRIFDAIPASWLKWLEENGRGIEYAPSTPWWMERQPANAQPQARQTSMRSG